MSGNANAGFNVILTAILYVVYAAILAAVFTKKRSVSKKKLKIVVARDPPAVMVESLL